RSSKAKFPTSDNQGSHYLGRGIDRRSSYHSRPRSWRWQDKLRRAIGTRSASVPSGVPWCPIERSCRRRFASCTVDCQKVLTTECCLRLPDHKCRARFSNKPCKTRSPIAQFGCPRLPWWCLEEHRERYSSGSHCRRPGNSLRWSSYRRSDRSSVRQSPAPLRRRPVQSYASGHDEPGWLHGSRSEVPVEVSRDHLNVPKCQMQPDVELCPAQRAAGYITTRQL